MTTSVFVFVGLLSVRHCVVSCDNFNLIVFIFAGKKKKSTHLIIMADLEQPNGNPDLVPDNSNPKNVQADPSDVDSEDPAKGGPQVARVYVCVVKLEVHRHRHLRIRMIKGWI